MVSENPSSLPLFLGKIITLCMPASLSTRIAIFLNQADLSNSDNLFRSMTSNKKDGVGIQLYPDGAKFEGWFKDGMFHGYGKMTQANKDVYMGQWSKDKASGNGTFYDAKLNVRYVGEWEEDLQSGYGEEIWGDDGGRTHYSGNFYKGKKHGHGRFEWADGSYYEGEFVGGNFQGKGKYYFADVDKVYEGEFRLGTIEGRGVELWNDGRRYDGDFKNGKKDGEGTFVWANASKYIGSWRDDKQHGIGIFCEGNVKRHGEWVNGKRIRWIQA